MPTTRTSYRVDQDDESNIYISDTLRFTYRRLQYEHLHQSARGVDGPPAEIHEQAS